MDSPGSKEQGLARVVAQRDKDFRGGIAPRIKGETKSLTYLSMSSRRGFRWAEAEGNVYRKFD